MWLWELDCKEGRGPKNWCLWTVVLEKTTESPSDCKEIQPVSLKGNQPQILIGRTDDKAEAPVFWSFDKNSQIIGKGPFAGNDWGQKEKRESEDEITGWNHQCNGYELGQTSRDSEGQGGLACCSPWSSIRHDWVTEQQQQWSQKYDLVIKQVSKRDESLKQRMSRNWETNGLKGSYKWTLKSPKTGMPWQSSC